MRRRICLTGAASAFVAIAGCTASGSGTSEPPPLQVTDVSVSGLESTGVAVEPIIERSKITPDRTAELSFTITWNGDGKRLLGFGDRNPFTSPNSSTDPPGLLLVHEDTHYERQDDETWVPEGPLPTGRLVGVVARLQPGESTSSETWEVWAHPDHASRIEPGTYTFDNTFGGDEESDNIDWSLTIEIEPE